VLCAPFLAQCCTWHRQVTSSEMHSDHVSAVWFLEPTLARINGWGEDLEFVYGFLRTIECIKGSSSSPQASGLETSVDRQWDRQHYQADPEPEQCNQVHSSNAQYSVAALRGVGFMRSWGTPGPDAGVSTSTSFLPTEWFLAPAHQDYPSIRNHYSPSASGLTMHQYTHLDKLLDSFLIGSRLPCFMVSVHKVCLLLSRCFCVIRHTGFTMDSLPCHFHCSVFSAAPNLCSAPTFRYTGYSDIHPINGLQALRRQNLCNSSRTEIRCCWACIRVAFYSLVQLRLQ
jgi:hypothetical protein